MPNRAICLILAVWLLAGCGSLPAGPPDAVAAAAENKAAQAGLAEAPNPSPPEAGGNAAPPAGTVSAEPPPALAAAGPDATGGVPTGSTGSGVFSPRQPGQGGLMLPRCAGWIWEGRVGADGSKQLDVAVLAFPNQPIFPALACWSPEGVTPPTPVLEVLQADGMPVHGVAHEHYDQKVNRHLWIFSVTAPPYRGTYYIRFHADGVEWVTIPFEVTDP